MNVLLTVDIIQELEKLLNSEKYKELSKILLSYSNNKKSQEKFEIPCLNEYDNEKLIQKVSNLWLSCNHCGKIKIIIRNIDELSGITG